LLYPKKYFIRRSIIMSYKKASDILPEELLMIIQDYIDGDYIYIPRKECNKKSWGEKTECKKEIYERNLIIYREHKNGLSIKSLSEKYFLSPKWIQKIIARLRLE
jgi:Mor family transcriptional regulator